MSDIPKRTIVNLATGEITEVELEGEELAAYQAALAAQTESEGS